MDENGIENPIAGVSPPKSRKKLWIFGGIGCLGVIGLLCVGGIVLTYMFAKPMLEFQSQNVEFAKLNPEVEMILGSPIEVGQIKPAPSGDEVTFSGPLTGPNGTGTLVFVGKLEGTEWVRKSIYLEFDGQKTPLEDMFEVDIDPGTSSGQ